MAGKPVQYDTLLRIRQLQQDRRAQDLAQTRRSIQRATETRDALAEQRQRILEEAAKRAEHVFYSKDVGLYYVYERHLWRLRNEKDAEIRQLRLVAEGQRRELEAAMLRKRMVEKLREKKVAAYVAALRKDEQKLMDESATNMAARRDA
jgi:flagellar FliJ protein